MQGWDRVSGCKARIGESGSWPRPKFRGGGPKSGGWGAELGSGDRSAGPGLEAQSPWLQGRDGVGSEVSDSRAGLFGHPWSSQGAERPRL